MIETVNAVLSDFGWNARAGEIAQLNRFMPHSKDRKNTGKSIIDQVCGMDRFPRNFR